MCMCMCMCMCVYIYIYIWRAEASASRSTAPSLDPQPSATRAHEQHAAYAPSRFAEDFRDMIREQEGDAVSLSLSLLVGWARQLPLLWSWTGHSPIAWGCAPWVKTIHLFVFSFVKVVHPGCKYHSARASVKWASGDWCAYLVAVTALDLQRDACYFLYKCLCGIQGYTMWRAMWCKAVEPCVMSQTIDCRHTYDICVHKHLRVVFLLWANECTLCCHAAPTPRGSAFFTPCRVVEGLTKANLA